MSSEHDDAIRQRAHEIWEQEGRPDGRSEAHWRQAVEELGTAGGAGASGTSDVEGLGTPGPDVVAPKISAGAAGPDAIDPKSRAGAPGLDAIDPKGRAGAPGSDIPAAPMKRPTI